MTAEVIGVAGEHPGPRRRMEVRVLGHIEATIADRPVALGGAKQRAVLAMLGLEANRPVTADRLIEGLWGEDPPPSAAKMVQNYVLRLRKALADDGGSEIATRGRAYELRIDRELVDACRLERLVAAAGRAAEARRPPRRGPPPPRGPGSPTAGRGRRSRCPAASRWPTSRTSRSPARRSGASR